MMMRVWRNKFVQLLKNTSYETTAVIFVKSEEREVYAVRSAMWFHYSEKIDMDDDYENQGDEHPIPTPDDDHEIYDERRREKRKSS